MAGSERAVDQQHGCHPAARGAGGASVTGTTNGSGGGGDFPKTPLTLAGTAPAPAAAGSPVYKTPLTVPTPPATNPEDDLLKKQRLALAGN